MTSISDGVHYLLNYIKYPKLRDFTKMGVGISARQERCLKWWEPHLRLTKEFIRDTFEKNGTLGKVGVFGAGRLLDIDLNWIGERSSEIHLFDADPGCLKIWNSINCKAKIVPHILDLSGCMELWTTELRRLLRDGISLEQTIVYLRSVSAPPISLNVELDTVISLNIMSQIPVYWRDRVFDLIAKHCKATHNLDSELNSALIYSTSVLQEQHMDLLGTSGAKLIAIISDTHWMYYTTDQSEWQVELAIAGDAKKRFSGEICTGYKPIAHEKWFWHIAPQGIENKDYGSIHQVEAWGLRR